MTISFIFFLAHSILPLSLCKHSITILIHIMESSSDFCRWLITMLNHSSLHEIILGHSHHRRSALFTSKHSPVPPFLSSFISWWSVFQINKSHELILIEHLISITVAHIPCLINFFFINSWFGILISTRELLVVHRSKSGDGVNRTGKFIPEF